MKRVLIHESSDETDNEGKIIKQLKERFRTTIKSIEKVQIRPIRKIQSEFGATNYMAWKAKDLVREKGVFATPNPKLGHPIAPKTADFVCGFMSPMM